MTNPIGSGTCNVPVNMLTDERSIIGRLAFERGISQGEYLRRVIRRGIALSDPISAKRMAQLRRARHVIGLALLAAGLLFVGSSVTMRRPARIVRVSQHQPARRIESA
jgi:hypothetical protein